MCNVCSAPFRICDGEREQGLPLRELFLHTPRTQTPAWGVRHALARRSFKPPQPRIHVQQMHPGVFLAGPGFRMWIFAMILSTSNLTSRLARAITGILPPISIPTVHPSIKKAPPWQEFHPSSLLESHHCLLVTDLPLLQRHRKPHTHLFRCDQELIQYT
jgi:hypothetical protein